MARGKKKESALTPEEKLAQALIPEDEQPYKVPGNWCWVHLDAVLTEIKNGTTIKQDKSGEGYSITRIESLQNQTIDFGRLGNIVDASAIKETDWYQEGDIALSHINSAEHVGKTALITSDMLPLVHGMNLLRLRFNEACLPVFYQYYSQSFQYKSEILDRINMAVNQVSINQKQLGSMEFPLPPIKEQQRIVDRIEYLFAKLDESKEKAQSVLDSFETRKAAILHKAFTGELTAKWRAEHGVGEDSWQDRPLKNCGSWYGGGTPSTARQEYWENGTLLWITSKDMKSDLIEDTLMHTTMLGVENSSANYIEESAVLFVMRSGILRRTFPVCMVKKPFTVNQDLKALVPRDIDLEYLFWACKAAEKEILEKCMKSGTTVESINASALQNFLIPVAGKEEQSEIVRILDSLFAKEQQAKEAAEAVLEKIDLLKKSILARAFRGELGTNDPTEESALELLIKNL